MKGAIQKANDNLPIRPQPLRSAPASSRIQPTRDPLPHHGAGDLAGHRRGGPTCWSPESQPVEPSRAFPLHQERAGKKDRLGGRGTGFEPGDHADAERAAAQARSHKIQGIGGRFHSADAGPRRGGPHRGRLPTTNPWETARRLAREEGILSGISSGAAVCGGRQAGARPRVRRPDHRGHTARFPASAYLSSVLFDGIA